MPVQFSISNVSKIIIWSENQTDLGNKKYLLQEFGLLQKLYSETFMENSCSIYPPMLSTDSKMNNSSYGHGVRKDVSVCLTYPYVFLLGNVKIENMSVNFNVSCLNCCLSNCLSVVNVQTSVLILHQPPFIMITHIILYHISRMVFRKRFAGIERNGKGCK